MRTQVGIIGAGPAGLLLSHLLHLQGIESVVLEARPREYVQGRVRAGILEQGTVDTLREAGVGKRLDAESIFQAGLNIRFGERTHRIDLVDLVGRGVTVYGQQEVVKDLIARRLDDGGDVRFGVADVRIENLGTPRISFVENGAGETLDCDFVIGADGFHGISRGQVPGLVHYEHTYPYAWLGILVEAPPSDPEVIYCRHERGFALHSMRSERVTRLYLQVDPDEDVANWPEDRIWSELHLRFTDVDGFELTEGRIFDKSITPMRSFVAAPMQHGRLFLAGDAAHIVPPTGAKGMNLAVADVRLLSRALGGFYYGNREDLLAAYTEKALKRVWRATHFSWWMTTTLHKAPSGAAIEQQLALSQLAFIASSRSQATALAENYTGLPYESGWSYR
ncbi:4-hydroxybenzoate 3-monooxygenase [Amycolatopsis carbonis]|uniref:4-hydroxybenzoate 3-monooxygenase n=1 Tax=Amycolatopsis carbonis TaxID=715471 RepID=A0A9Y2IMX8_9PSEU|nr:4-hydroxybenzoate 3-monooxygenase [Amycolatopsis sp. 2-15]WIX82216.1 4-hydroxybenzoate 3-monooxygenase [Amycolatopsis sp. 2-15]